MILADCHVHTCMSTDSDAPVRGQVDAAIAAGLKAVCITDHLDLNFPGGGFLLDPVSYGKTLEEIRAEYEGRIEVLRGVELGLQTCIPEETVEAAKTFSRDFIIGSIHVVDGFDPYEKPYWDVHSDEEGYRRYFEVSLENAQKYDCFDTFGHLDYIIRYGRTKNSNYRFSDYADVIDEILKILIRKDIALEVNTAGFKYGLNAPNPEENLIRRYLELGGELITIGSDAHSPEYVAYEFDRVREYLAACGAKSYAVFRNRKPELYPL